MAIMRGLPLNETDLREEFELCKADFNYFRMNYLPVLDRDTSRKVRFKLRPAQKLALKVFAQNGSSMILKFRRAGVSRVFMARIFHKVMFNAGIAAISVVHNDEDAVAMFTQVREWYDGLPDWMKQGPFKAKSNRSDELTLGHGGCYRVVSARASPAGGPTWWYRHYSEFAKYPDPERLIRIIESGSAAHGRAIYETTAEGLGYGFLTWRNENGWGKQFLCWTTDPGYAWTDEELSAKVTFERPAIGKQIADEVHKYGQDYGLSLDQERWVIGQLVRLNWNPNDPDASWRAFHNEFPITAALAFTTARGRVFLAHYPDARVRTGYRQYREPQPYRVYVVGSDAASGSPDGDFQAFVCLDVTEPERPLICSTFYDRIENPLFAQKVGDECKKYGALLVSERDAWGQDVQNRVMEDGWHMLWRETYKDRTSGNVSERLGRTPGTAANAELVALLQEYLNQGKLDPAIDERLCYEVNDFQFDDKGKAEAVRPNHDDLIRALGLALVGRQQIQVVQEARLRKRPVTLEERVAFKTATGHSPGPQDHFEPDLWDEMFGKRDHGITSIFDMTRQQ